MYGAGTASRERADAKEMSPAFLPKKKKKEKFVKNKQIYHKFIWVLKTYLNYWTVQ